MTATVTVSTTDGQPVTVNVVNAITGDVMIPPELVDGFDVRTFYVVDVCEVKISAADDDATV